MVAQAAMAAMAAWISNGVDDMTNLARIQNGIVAEVISNANDDIAARYHPDFVAALVECGNDVQAGWRFDDGEFLPPPEPETPAPPPRVIAGAYFRGALAQMQRLDEVVAALTNPVDLELFRGATAFNEGDADVNAVADALAIDLAEVFDRAEAIRNQRQR